MKMFKFTTEEEGCQYIHGDTLKEAISTFYTQLECKPISTWRFDEAIYKTSTNKEAIQTLQIALEDLDTLLSIQEVELIEANFNTIFELQES